MGCVFPYFTPTFAISRFDSTVVLLFEVYRQVVHQPGEPIEPSVVAALTPAHRWLVAHRWPEQFPSAALNTTAPPVLS
jgi:hypothetical protein